MYKVFNEALQSDIGRTKVRKYLRTTDTQAVWKEYSEYMTTASKGTSEKRKLTQYVTNTILDRQLRGTTQHFDLYFNEQFRRLDDLTDFSERMPESIKMALLKNAVKDIPQLSIVETMMTTVELHLDMVLLHTFHTHPIMIFSSMHVSGMIPPTLQPPETEEMCTQLLEHKLTPTLMSTTKHCSPKALIHLQMISTKCTRPNRVNHHQTVVSFSEGTIQESFLIYTQAVT